MSQATEAKKPTASTPVTGTREWAAESVNCVTGCSHDCKYCYARERAQRVGQVAPGDWPNMRVREHDVKKPRKKLSGRVMFPTTHDVTPEVMEPCLTVLGKLLAAGNDVLFVSKPHLSVIKEIVSRFQVGPGRLTFRFSIGSPYRQTLESIEPGAPSLDERLECLRYVHESGMAVGVSAEPLLDPNFARDLVDMVGPYVDDAIWIGCLNKIRQRWIGRTTADNEHINFLEAWQTPESIRRVRDSVMTSPWASLVKWKESYKNALGMDLVDHAGADV